MGPHFWCNGDVRQKSMYLTTVLHYLHSNIETSFPLPLCHLSCQFHSLLQCLLQKFRIFKVFISILLSLQLRPKRNLGDSNVNRNNVNSLKNASSTIRSLTRETDGPQQGLLLTIGFISVALLMTARMYRPLKSETQNTLQLKTQPRLITSGR